MRLFLRALSIAIIVAANVVDLYMHYKHGTPFLYGIIMFSAGGASLSAFIETKG